MGGPKRGFGALKPQLLPSSCVLVHSGRASGIVTGNRLRPGLPGEGAHPWRVHARQRVRGSGTGFCRPDWKAWLSGQGHPFPGCAATLRPWEGLAVDTLPAEGCLEVPPLGGPCQLSPLSEPSSWLSSLLFVAPNCPQLGLGSAGGVSQPRACRPGHQGGANLGSEACFLLPGVDGDRPWSSPRPPEFLSEPLPFRGQGAGSCLPSQTPPRCAHLHVLWCMRPHCSCVCTHWCVCLCVPWCVCTVACMRPCTDPPACLGCPLGLPE